MSDEVERYKYEAAMAAVEAVRPGMVVGLGHGSTAIHALREIARRLKHGELHGVQGLPCSDHVAWQAHALGIPLTTFERTAAADLTIDGADELTEFCDAIKGGGGALLTEKIVHQNSRRIILVADHTKLSARLGGRCALPVEVAIFGWQAQRRFMEALGAEAVLRTEDSGEPFVTEQGHYILDCRFESMGDIAALSKKLDGRAGVMEHGLFLGLAHEARVAGPEGVRTLSRG
ncbi:ribose 5-phosphate isomerase A [Oceanidesulfovibrio indonesiensis]|uniref:Ribose 5-phosphate isomerase A n=1 Tax=Oceanidesulfovibrio indonesiensis TaxID=54767 RepID=A0A7M3MHH3_9BACT|nr:ribose-5-phosphate isomerase RpiA [Oceanidesulfovibrio indonesiensis]TVM18946.1 ribose 5-phosphate isomerase A [Oceanidesulfovibrio indonesiensis]